MPTILKIRIILFSILALVIIFLIYKALSPFGEITYTAKPCDNSFFIQKLKPKDRVSGDCQNIITGDPVYFNLNTQRTFNEAEVKINYKNSGHNKIVEIGIMADERKNYRLKPLDNIILDNLNWNTLEKDGIYLFQKENNYNSIDEFLNKIPDKNEILTYFYDLPPQKELSELKKFEPTLSSKNRTATHLIENDLRGPYQFYTYTDDGILEFEFLFSDLNINKDADNIKIVVYDLENNIMAQREMQDERGGEETRNTVNAEGLHLDLTNLKKGFYKIELITNDDIITTQITASQKIVAFINRIWLAYSSNTDLITLFSDASEVTASTINPQALQKISVNKDILNLSETYKQFSISTVKQTNTIQFAKNDVIISGSGVFSFSESALYNPNYKKLTKNTNLANTNYIITTYRPDKTNDDWQTKTLTFDLKNSLWYENNYGFIISVPGLISDDDVDDFVEIGDIEIKLKGRSLWEKIKSVTNF